MKTVKVAAVVFILCVFAGSISPLVSAEVETTNNGRGGDQVDELMGRYNLYPAFEKGGRGLSNFLGGWLEIPYNIQTRFSKSDTGGSLITGLFHGLVRAVVRTGVGAYETVTFFLPYPENFAPILPTLPYYQKTTRRDPPLWE